MNASKDLINKRVASHIGIITSVVGCIMLICASSGLILDYLDDFTIASDNNWFILAIMSMATFILSIKYILISMNPLSNKKFDDNTKDCLLVTSDMPGNYLAPIAMSVHNLTGRMPVVIKSKNDGGGVLVENGAVRDVDFNSDLMDIVFMGERTKSVKVSNGRYAGSRLFISAITDQEDKPIASLGLIDLSGIMTLKEFMDIRAHIDGQIRLDK